MALMILKRTTPSVKAKPSMIRLVSFNRKHGLVMFNVCSSKELGLTDEGRILFAKDTETRQWFFTIGSIEDLSEGNTLQIRTNSSGSNSMRVAARNVVEAVCDDFKAESITFCIAQKPKLMEGRQWWRIITATPYRKI